MSNQKKVLIVFGTRPEAIKMAPLAKGFIEHTIDFNTKICVTAQHREMLDQVLDFFELGVDYDLNLMKPNQNLYQLTADVLLGMKKVLEEFKPDYMFVHGDTTTSSIAALAGFYAGVKVCHVEAGLRTYNKLSPFPEEINRQLTGRLADFHFAPTENAAQNLLREGVSSNSINVTGNTVIDALLLATKKIDTFSNEEIRRLSDIIQPQKKIILVTGHRRENMGNGFQNIAAALRVIAERDDVQIVFPVHLNPRVKNVMHEQLGGLSTVHLLEPLSYPSFIWIMKRSFLILTDSGGIQEEAPSLGIPVLVLRDTTERPEAIKAGTVKLVGTKKDDILRETLKLLNDENEYNSYKQVINPYGDGLAVKRIIKATIKLKEEV